MTKQDKNEKIELGEFLKSWRLFVRTRIGIIKTLQLCKVNLIIDCSKASFIYITLDLVELVTFLLQVLHYYDESPSSSRMHPSCCSSRGTCRHLTYTMKTVIYDKTVLCSLYENINFIILKTKSINNKLDSTKPINWPRLIFLLRR